MCNGYYSFNRYMVECELESGCTRRVCYRVLIDTWWNVNLSERECQHKFFLF